MTASLALAAIWALGAVAAALLPRIARRRAVDTLIGAGVPILGYVTFQNGPWTGLLVLAAGVLLLRLPVCRARRWTDDAWHRIRGAE